MVISSNILDISSNHYKIIMQLFIIPLRKNACDQAVWPNITSYLPSKAAVSTVYAQTPFFLAVFMNEKMSADA